MIPAGTLIWISCLPLLRLFICVACGYGVTKADLFPASAARGAGQIMLNITVPSLMFSKIVPAFTSQNISALGPLVLIAVIYQVLGIAIAWTTKQIFWVPHRFRWGILVAGGWGNYGDIPTSIAISIAGAAPFNGTSDQTLSVAYISGLSLFYMITFFPLGGHKLVALDYTGPDVEPEDLRAAARQRRLAIFSLLPQKLVRLLPFRGSSSVPMAEADEHGRDLPIVIIGEEVAVESKIETHLVPVALSSDSQSLSIKDDKHSESLPELLRDELPPPSTLHKIWLRLSTFVRELCYPASLSIILSFPIALIPALKGLFVPVTSPHIPSAPDGRPPLSFLFDTTTFIGAASVPLGLICLGSALARLEIPRGRWNHLPVGAILSMAVGRMMLMPVLGVLIAKGLTNAGIISREDKVLQFICIIFSCLPTGTTQVFVTQVYSGTGSAEHLSAFLIPQYILMFLSMTGLIAYSIENLF
ncbi:auxin efflux carrier transmembrane protein [Mycena alexandri]|uniref:Auxin efflux carrier transmembrane protein n=1 Tax=Mycena alexandri TaxID=1745969 RepID=A0AAD6WVU4_9AGAR|nr:auxin efflux carrier transmembrane protein [Mycena alexandri]KAJ7035229.1 auxin efflux carrier transmembrane protein [Mycena alexandri]